uniref:Rho GTPase activating protein n=1 Tax=Panagrolaimus sp. JU765 TaxID=591449 RepID=A0AC34PVW8_9BILA
MISSIIGLSNNLPETNKPINVVTISVIGLSGPDSIRGPCGIGKSALCNRLVRPNFEQFYLHHASLLSQTDFSGPVINNDHWLYWGEAELGQDYPGKITHVRIIEQTEFIDDETFEPIRSARQIGDYVKRATRVNLESRDKLMYICPDQLGDESSFESNYLTDGRTTVDAFILAFDVSRHIPGQYENAINLIQAATKVKKQVFLVGTKFDAIKKNFESLNDLQKILRKKELKNVFSTIIETSAKENVNVTDLLKFMAMNLEKYKGKLKVLTYAEGFEIQILKMREAKDNFMSLIAQLLPKEEWPRRHHQLTWKKLVNEFGFAYQPAYVEFISIFGTKEAEKIYESHMKKSQDWWTTKEQREKLPALRNVFLELFDYNSIIEMKWEDVIYETEQHPMFDRYFKPLGQSLDRYIYHSQDARIPAELLHTFEAQHMFLELQKEIENKAVLDAQIERFISFLANKEVIIPGRKYSDAKILVSEIETFEQFLPNGRAEQAYDDFQNVLINEAERAFLELLQERLPMFITFLLLKNEQKENEKLDKDVENFFVDSLQDDKRFRNLSGLPERRRKILQRFSRFILNPLNDYCPAGTLCANRQISKIIDAHRTHQKFTLVDIVVCGEDFLVDEFITAVNMSLSVDKLFDFDSGLAKISCFKSSDPLSSSRIRSLVFVVDSSEALEQLLTRKWHYPSSLAPLFVNACSQTEKTLHKTVSQVADKIGGVYISDENLLGSDGDSVHSLTSHFNHDQVQRVLREVCHSQLCGSYADLRIQMSFMCGDFFKPDVVLSMLLDQSNHSTLSENVFTMDQHLPNENLNIRVRIDATSYHSWLLCSTGWPMNSINGHVLIYSPQRTSSWHHAEIAARMLLESAGNNLDDRTIIGKSILFLAIDDPANYFDNKNSRLLLTLGNKFAEEIGASFATLSPNLSCLSQTELFINYFEQIYNNEQLPDCYYFSMILPSKTFLLNDSSCTSSDDGQTIIRAGGYTTLNSTGSIASHESNDSGASANSVNGAYSGAVRTPCSRRIASSSAYACSNSSNSEFKLPTSPTSSTGGNAAANNSRRLRSDFMSRLSSRSNQSAGSNETSPVAPLAKPEFDASHEFYYEDYREDPNFININAQQAASGTSNLSTPSTSNPNRSNIPVLSKSQRKIEKFLPKFGRLILENSSSSSQPPPNATTIILDPAKSSDVPSLAKSVEERIPLPIKFRVNGTERNIDDHGNVSIRPVGARISHIIRSHSSESIFLDVDTNQEPPESPPPIKGFSRNKRVIRRQGSLRDRSYSKLKRSFFTAANEKSTNLANKFVSSFRPKKERANTIAQQSTDDGIEITNISRLDSFGNPLGRSITSSSVPHSPSMTKKSGLSKTSTAVSNALSWLPNRAQKRSLRAKSEGVEQLSSSPSPVETLQTLCDAETTVDGVPLFAYKCINFIEKNGGLETEGLYRVPGNQSQVTELEKQFKNNPDVVLENLSLPIHVVATAIKKFFDTLPEPIISSSLHSGILKIIESLNDSSPGSRSKSSLGSPCSYATAPEYVEEYPIREQHIERLSRFLKLNLPSVNRRVLHYLTAHLKRVSNNYEKNSMDVRNLSKIFGPTLFRPEFDSFEMMASQMAKFELAMYLILQNCDQMLGPD